MMLRLSLFVFFLLRCNVFLFAQYPHAIWPVAETSHAPYKVRIHIVHEYETKVSRLLPNLPSQPISETHQKGVYEDSNVTEGTLYQYQVTLFSQNDSPQRTFSLKVSIPKDIRIHNTLSLVEDTVFKAHRIFIASNVKLITQSHALTLIANEMNGENWSLWSSLSHPIKYLSQKPVYLYLNHATGSLDLDLAASTGKRGTPGIAGKRGAQGRQGNPGRSVPLGLLSSNDKNKSFLCIETPTNGLPGGSGFDGSAGTDGESGKDLEQVFVWINNSHNFYMHTKLTPGKPGNPGPGGLGGKGGEGGEPGTPAQGCPNAQKGPQGPEGTPGKDGDSGSPGQIQSLCIHLSQKIEGECYDL